MEPTLVVIGVSLRSAKLGVRERFLLSAAQKSEALTTLVRSEAIDEVIVLSTCNRTEFLVWSEDALDAANSVLRYLTRSMNLKLAEWTNYYRLVGDAAVAHVLRVTSGADGLGLADSQSAESMLAAWQMAQRASTTGRFLDALMAKALSTASRVRQEHSAALLQPTIANAAVAVCAEVLGDLRHRRIVVLGAGQVALPVLRELKGAGAGELTIVNRSWDNAERIARQLQVKAAHVETLWEQVLRADAVIAASAGKVQVTREELEIVLRERKDKRILVLDLSVPRTVEPAIRELEGVSAYDLDDLSAAMAHSEPRLAMLRAAERIIAEETAGFRTKLISESAVSSIAAIRKGLELICGQEMDQLREQFGPFTEDQEVALHTLSAHIAQRIAAALARQMKEMPERSELTSAVQQLFQLEVGGLKAEAKVWGS